MLSHLLPAEGVNGLDHQSPFIPRKDIDVLCSLTSKFNHGATYMRRGEGLVSF